MTEELKQKAEQDADNASGLDLSTTLMVAKDKTDAYRLGRFDGYISSAEPREKRIAELEDKLANADYQLEGRDLEVMEFKAELEREKNLNQCLSDHNEQLRDLIEKIKSDSKAAYIKGIRTMANALKEYDKTEGSWTDYFEHTVDKVLKNLLKE